MKIKLAKTVTALLLLLLILNSCMYLQQPTMIFFPSSEIAQTPANWNLEYEDVSFNAEDGTQLHGWYIPHPGASKVLLFFHGNGGNISHRGDSVTIFHNLGLNVFIIDYRGYGKSQGVASEDGIYQDAAAAWQYLTQTRNHASKDIIIFGRSLGGAVATHLATEVQAGALILESTFSSARDMAHTMLPLLSRLVLPRYRFDTERRIPRVNCPLLVLHSPDDEIIPFHLGEKVFQAAKQPKSFVALHGDHNSGFLQSRPEYEAALRQFVSEY